MNIVLIGGAGFIGTNLTIKLAENKENHITLVDRNINYFEDVQHFSFDNVSYLAVDLNTEMDFNEILKGQDIVYHMYSSNVPTTSNEHISEDIRNNVVFSSKLFEGCVANDIKKIVFISSGGTVYGKNADCPIKEESATDPISSYGLQKLTIEKLLYLYNHIYGLDYKVIRLANPYGPYQRPNGILGAVTTFVYKALKDEEIVVYGDGSVVRDFIYIDDAVEAIKNITFDSSDNKIFNVGSGKGTSINEILNFISTSLKQELNVSYKAGRKADVATNFLDIKKYETLFGKLEKTKLSEGIIKTAEFIKERYIKE